jgi:hypothetical protein
VIYSRFDPVEGHYDYFDAGGPLAALNDDLPVPKLPPPVAGKGGSIGVPSVECGRPLPSGAVHIGSGLFAEGHITPPSHVRLAGTGAFPWIADIGSFLMGALAVGTVWLVWGRR